MRRIIIVILFSIIYSCSPLTGIMVEGGKRPYLIKDIKIEGGLFSIVAECSGQVYDIISYRAGVFSNKDSLIIGHTYHLRLIPIQLSTDSFRDTFYKDSTLFDCVVIHTSIDRSTVFTSFDLNGIYLLDNDEPSPNNPEFYYHAYGIAESAVFEIEKNNKNKWFLRHNIFYKKR